jgi:hypothetical protein
VWRRSAHHSTNTQQWCAIDQLLKDDGLVIAPQRRPDSRPPADIVHRWPKLYDDGLTTDSATFRARFETFTQGQLRHLDWGNVLVVGGAVTIPLAHTPDLSTWDQRYDARYFRYRMPPSAEETQLCRGWAEGGIPLDAYYQRLFGPSDIDLYLYGLTPEQAKQKVMCHSPPPPPSTSDARSRILTRVVCVVCGVCVLWGGGIGERDLSSGPVGGQPAGSLRVLQGRGDPFRRLQLPSDPNHDQVRAYITHIAHTHTSQMPLG